MKATKIKFKNGLISFSICLFSTIFTNAQIPKVESWDFKDNACATTKGWTNITTLDKNEEIKIEVNGYGHTDATWYSNGEPFHAMGKRHEDSRHPFPKKNAMAIIFRVIDDGETSYHELCCDLGTKKAFNPKSFEYKSSSDGTKISWIINDWQDRGLYDNSGCIILYVSKR